MRYALMVVALATACLFTGVSEVWAGISGHFTLVEGRVDILKKGAAAVVPVVNGDAVAVGDIVRTKSHSRAQIELVDKSQLNLAENTRMEIRRFSFSGGGAQAKRDGLFHLFRGKLRSIVQHNESDERFNFQVETPTAVAAVRGTDLSTLVKSDALTIVAVRQGKVQVSNQKGATVFITTNQYTRVFGTLPPTTPKLMTPAMKEQLFSKLSDQAPNAGGGGKGKAEAKGEANKGEANGKGNQGEAKGEGNGNATGENKTASTGDKGSTTDTASSTGTSGEGAGESTTTPTNTGGGNMATGGADLPELPEAPSVTAGTGSDVGLGGDVTVGNSTSTTTTTTTEPVTAANPVTPVTPVTPPITSSAPAILTAPVTIKVNF